MARWPKTGLSALRVLSIESNCVTISIFQQIHYKA